MKPKKRLVKEAKETYKDLTPLSVKVLEAKNKKGLLSLLTYIRQGDSKIIDFNKLNYIVLIEKKTLIELCYYSKDSKDPLHRDEFVYNSKSKFLKDLKKFMTVEYDIKRRNKIYDICFAIMLYIAVFKDVGVWAFNISGGFTVGFFAIIFIFSIFIPIFYFFYKTLASNDRSRQYFYQFVYLMAIKLSMFFLNFLTLVSGLILILTVAIFSIGWNIYKERHIFIQLSQSRKDLILFCTMIILFFIGFTPSLVYWTSLTPNEQIKFFNIFFIITGPFLMIVSIVIAINIIPIKLKKKKYNDIPIIILGCILFFFTGLWALLNTIFSGLTI